MYNIARGLAERGFIRRLPNRARALEVLRLPASSTPADSGRSKKFAPSVIEGPLGRVRAWGQSDSGDELERAAISIPVMGRIAAGTPIAALQNRSHTISLPPDMLPPGDYYALEVRGDSMIDAGIFDNDTVVIRKQDTAETGDIVVALIGAEEAPLKRLAKRGASTALEAANPAYETPIFGPDRVRIQGKLVNLVRKY